MNQRLPLIGVIGSGAVDTATGDIAYQVGRALGRAGCHLLCGGRGGVMEAACQGHHQGRQGLDPRGVTIGLLPGNDQNDANAFVDIVITTGLGLARNAVIACGAQALIAVSGGSGTLSEISFAWQMHRPVAALVSSGGWASRLAGTSLDDKRADAIYLANTADDAVTYVLHAIDN